MTGIRSIATRGLRIAAVLVAALAATVAAAQDAPPAATVAVDLDAATGALRVEATLTAPRGTVAPPPVPWLTLRAVSVDGVAAPEGPVPESRHRGAPVTMRYDGTLPDAADRQPGGFDGEAAFLTGAAWLPRDDAPLRTFTLRAAATGDWRVAGTGARDTDDGRTVLRFTGRPDALALFFGPYAIDTRMHRGLALRTFLEADDAALSASYLDALARHIDRFEAEVGPYPYDGFSVVSATLPVGLGFAGATYVSRDILTHPYMRGRSLAHEVLHSWWGAAVGIDYARGNWAEGLTTYMADHALAEDEGTDRAMRTGWIRELAAIAPEAARPLTDFRSAAEASGQGEGYGKVALVFHMLRARIGDAAFTDGIGRFYAAQRDRVAAWSDLQTAFEAASGTDLSDFFAQWLTRPGVPRIALDAATRQPDGRTVVLRLSQDTPPYDLRVPVVFDTEAGPERRVLALRTDRARYRVTLPAAVTGLRVDPGFDLARAPGTHELAPILGDLRRGRLSGVSLAGDADTDAALRAAASPLAAGIDWVGSDIDALAASAPDGPALVAGPPDAVRAARARLVPGDAPAPPEGGAARLWVDRGTAGRVIAFLETDAPARLVEDLRGLGFYLGRSGVALADGRAVDTRTPVDTGGALRVRFD